MKIETKTQIMAPGHHLPFEVVSLVLQGGGALEYLESLSPKKRLSPVVPSPGFVRALTRSRGRAGASTILGRLRRWPSRQRR